LCKVYVELDYANHTATYPIKDRVILTVVEVVDVLIVLIYYGVNAVLVAFPPTEK